MEFAPFAKPGFLIRRLQQISIRIFQDSVAPFTISTIQFGALEVIAARPGIDQVSLSQATDIDRTTIVRVIDRLEADGFVNRKSNPLNRRVNVLFVTASGQRLLQDVTELATASQIKLLSPLTPADQKSFMRMLAQLIAAHASDQDGKRYVLTQAALAK